MRTIETPTRIIPTAHDIGDTVYHRLAPEWCKGIVTGISIAPDGVSYLVAWPDHSQRRHYAIELSRDYVPSYEGGM